MELRRITRKLFRENWGKGGIRQKVEAQNNWNWKYHQSSKEYGHIRGEWTW